MNGRRGRGGWRGLAAGLAGGLVLLLIGDRGAFSAPPSGLGIDPFEVLDLQVKNNVLIVLDTSGSMKFVTDRDDFPVGADDPSSRLFQLKEAVKAVVTANQTKVNLGLATYNVLQVNKTINRDADDDNDTLTGTDNDDGPFIYVSADATAAPFYNSGQGCTGVDGFFCQMSGTFGTYSVTPYRAFSNRQGGSAVGSGGNAFDDPYPANCTAGSGQLTPVLPSLATVGPPAGLPGSGMRCRHYIQSRLIQRNALYHVTRSAATAAARVVLDATPITCPAPPLGLVGYNSSVPICFQFQDMDTSGQPISTYYFTSATFEPKSTESNCAGAALLNQVAPCAGNNAPAILTSMDPELPVCTSLPQAGCTAIGDLRGVPAAPGNATFDYADGHLDGDNILTDMGGLRAGQSTPLAGTLSFIRTAAPAAFPTQAPGTNQKNFVILLTDGDDTCASGATTDRKAVQAAGEAELLYLNTGDFVHQAETLMVAFTSAVNPARVNVIGQAGSGRDIDETQSTPALAMGTPLRTCRTGGACRNAFVATSTQELIDVLNAAIEQAASNAVFSATASIFDGVPEYVNRFSPRRLGPPGSDINDPLTRYLDDPDRNPGALIAYRALFNAQGFRGIVKGFSTTGPIQIPKLGGGVRDWEAGQTLLDRISRDLTVGDPTFAPHIFTDMFPPGGTDHLQRRIFTTSRNGVTLGNVKLWPPDTTTSPVIAPTDLSGGLLDEPLFRKFDNTQMTTAEMQAAPFKACLGTNLAATACATSLAAQAKKETREMILAFTAGAEAQRNAAGEPERDVDGKILYQARTWILSESTLGQPAMVPPPLETKTATHVPEYTLYRDGPRNGGVAANKIDEGFGLRNPDKDGVPASANNPALKPVMTVVYVPANDMLHAFRAGPSCGGVPAPPSCVGGDNGGEELWGFVPYDLLPKLKDKLKSQTRLDHTFMLANSIRFADVFVPGTFVEPATGITYSGKWRRVLLAGRGIGGKYYSALDITSPGTYTRLALTTNLPAVLWNRGNPDTADGMPAGAANGTPAELTNYANMGQTWSTPIISPVDPARNSGKEYVAYTGSGYGVNFDPTTRVYTPVAGQGTRFYALDPMTGSILNTFDVGSAPGAFANVPNALLANPVHFARLLLSITDRKNPATIRTTEVFEGDLHGRMWKVDTNNSGTPIAYYDGGVAQPIATAAALLPKNDLPWVFFETGYDQRVVPGTLFKAVAVSDNGTSPGNVDILQDFPGAVGGHGPYRGTLQPVTAPTAAGFAAFFPGTRFNPITGGSCVSSFDTIVIRARLPGSAVGAIDTAEYLGVKAVGTPRPPTDATLIDAGTPPPGGGEPFTPLPPNRALPPVGSGGGQTVHSLIFRPTAPVCRER